MLLHLIETGFGWAAMAGSECGIVGFDCPMPKKEQSLARALCHWPDARVVDSDFSGESERIVEYFAGKHVEFQCALDFSGVGDFDISVWNAARRIPYGEVQTYGWIADMIGRPGAARAVGQALGRNRILLIVPCHRVIRSDGALGGFASGIEWKRRMLALEGVPGYGAQTPVAG